jgi:amino acid adenylation domain-containing protein
MTLKKLLQTLNERNIKLALNTDGTIKVVGDKHLLTAELVSEIKALKNEITSWLSQTPAQARPKIERRGDISECAVSFAQQRLWFIDNLQRGSAAFNIPLVLEVKGELDLAIVEKVFTTIISRHEILRTVYLQSEGEIRQRIRPQSEVMFKLYHEDISHLSEELLTQKVAQVVEEDMNTGFDLASQLMLRVTYLSVGAEAGVMIFNMHHIASDGWSMEVLTKEFFTLYQAFNAGESDPLPALPIQYADYAHWQRNYLSGEVLEKQLHYWEKQLDDLPVVHSLALDRPRPEIKSHKGAAVEGQLGSSTATALLAIAKQYQLTPFMLVHGLFALLIARHSNNDDIVIGSPVANRMEAELAPLIGYFSSALILRANTQHTSLQAYFAHIKRVNQEALAHQDVPFELLVQRLNIPRSVAHTPLFQIMLSTNSDYGVNGENAKSTLALSGVSFKNYESDTLQSKFDLHLDVSINEQGVSLHWLYDESLFNHAHISQLNTHFCHLLMRLAENTVVDLSTLSILPDAEVMGLLADFSDDKPSSNRDMCIHEVFEHYAQTNSEQIAVVNGQQKLTYKQLNDKANQLAQYLVTQHKVRTEELIGVCTERSTEMVVAILAILKSGAAYVPLDPAYPQDRLAFMIEDASIGLILSHSQVTQTLSGLDTQVIFIDDLDVSNYGAENISKQQVQVTANNLAYVIYTSGSTGTPKGVMIEHRSLCNYLAHIQDVYQVEPNDKVLQFSSMSFDIFVEELCASLCSGAQLVLSDDTCRHSFKHFIEFCDHHEVSIASLPTAFWSQLVTDSEKVVSNSLKKLIVGGEALTPMTVQEHYRALGENVQLINTYGPTEATITATAYRTVIDDAKKQHISIGRANVNYQLCVLDSHQQLSPDGAVGELYIGGPALARGYLNRADLTREAFVELLVNPHRPEQAYRLYRTGDLVRRLPDGQFTFMGRADDQIKIRGFRVEPGEISAKLNSLVQIKSSLVVVNTVTGVKQLVAYIQPEEKLITAQHNCFLQEIKDRLKVLLPQYMIPSAILVVEAWPLTVNGKIDKRALPAVAQCHTAIERVAAQTPTEQSLLETWAHILGISEQSISTRDNFFELGGHSLLIIKLVSQLKELGWEVDAAGLYVHAQLNEMASYLDSLSLSNTYQVPDNLISQSSQAITPEMLPLIELSQSDINHIIERIPGGVSNVQDIYPLAPLQEGVLFVHQMTSGRDPYTLAFALKCENEEALHRLIDGVNFIIARHDVFRTAILWRDRIVPVQVVVRAATAPITYLTEENVQANKESVLQYLEQGQFRIDLEAAPLLQLEVISGAQEKFVIFKGHHMVTDHVSFQFVLQELSAFLSSQYHNLTSPSNYREFVARTLWNLEHIDIKGFFRERFANIEAPSLPFDLTNVVGNGSNIVKRQVILDKTLSSRIYAVMRASQNSEATFFHAMWSIVIAACSGQQQAIFGTVLSGRMSGQKGIEQAMGMMINTLPFITDLKNISVKELVKQVANTLVSLLPYEQASLAEVQSYSNFGGDVPLFNCMLNYRRIIEERAHKQNSAFGIENLGAVQRSNYPIALSVDDYGVGEAFSLNIELDSTIDISRFISYIETAIENLLTALECEQEVAVATITIVPTAEVQALTVERNNTLATYPQDRCVHELFEAQVKARPDAVALTFNNENLTNKQLNEKANRLARYLRQAFDIQPDTRVGICIERSFEMIVAMLATLKAGAAYVPLDPDYPSERISNMVEDAAPQLVMTQAHLASRLATLSCPVLAINDDSEYITQSAENLAPLPDSCSRNLAYVIFTSGSTGRPKGVMIEHRSLQNHLHWIQQSHQLGSDDAILQKTPFSFDVSMWEIWWPLITEARLVITKPGGHREPDYLTETIIKQQITTAHFVPSMLNVLLDSEDWPQCDSLRRVFSGGEELKYALQEKFFATNVYSQLINLYGPAEATIDVTSWQCQKGKEVVVVPIGYPINNTQLYVLDANLNIVPTGVPGELFVAGDGLARGYINNPELTAQRFIDNPFSSSDGSKMYRTGDIVRANEKGQIEYLGRKDFQVKIRGVRIELGDIERAIASLANISRVVVLLKDLGGGNKQLVAYLSTNASAQFDKLSAMHTLSELLPEFMIPVHYVCVDSWPVTANGKLDQNALPLPSSDISSASHSAEPEGEIERYIAQAWSVLLSDIKVYRDDNFFDLGGHSLIAVRFITAVKQEKGWQLSLKELFSAPTVRKLALILGQSQIHIMSIDKADYAKPIPLSFAQQRLWFIEQMGQANHAYNIAGGYRFSGCLNKTFLQTALNEVQKKHEILRTRFTQTQDDQAIQLIDRPGIFALEEVQLTGLDKPLQEAELAVIVSDTVNTAFDLTKRAVRAVLVQLAPEEHVLVFAMHHIISDGWSTSILLNEVAQSYAQLSQGQSPELTPLALQYADYASWQRTVSHTQKLQDALDYWHQHLDGAAPLLELPYDKARPKVQSYQGSSFQFKISAELTDALKALAKQEELSLFMLLQAAWSILMAKLSGQSDIVTGVPIANRERVELEQMIGLFVNTIALRVNVDAEQTLSTFLQSVKEVAIDGFEHQAAPFEEVVERLQPQRSLGYTPIFQTMISLMNVPNEVAHLPGLEIEPYQSPVTTSKFDLILTMQEVSDELSCGLSYVCALFEDETIAQWATYFENILVELVSGNINQLSQISLLDEAAQTLQLMSLHGDVSCTEATDTVVHLFEQQVLKHPSYQAVSYEGESLTYAQLNAKANQLARHLRQQGVDQNDVVGLLLERNLDMIVSLLAVHKAGGAYLPLDPQYPKERVRYMLENAQPRLVITQQAFAAELEEAQLPHFTIEAVAHVLNEFETSNLVEDVSISPDDLAYVIYTSGSTGQPKGAMLAHKNLYNLMDDFADIVSAPAGKQAMLWASTCFDASVYEIFSALCFGMNLNIAPEKERFDPNRLFDWMARVGVNCGYIPPFFVQPLYEHLRKEANIPLRHIMVGVEPIPSKILARMKNYRPDLTIVNAYGPTEAAVYCSRHIVDKNNNSSRPAPIGCAVKNTQLYVLSEDMKPVPRGVTGELYVAGKGVAQGYIGNPEATEKQFVANPFTENQDALMYKTGDMVKQLNNGELEFVGRVDDQVKIRGVRIELGEVKTQLNQLKPVKDSVVSVYETQAGEKQIAAYVELHEADEQQLDIVKQQLSRSLPSHSMPTSFVLIKDWPRLPNKKVDKSKLPAPNLNKATKQYVAPSTQTEIKLQVIWSALLGLELEQVSIEQSFFELGGHSLLVLKLRSAIEDKFSIFMDMRQIFEHNRIQELAELLDRLCRRQELESQIENTNENELDTFEF